MIILNDSSGRLGNRLLISSHAIAYAMSRNEFIIDLGFYNYAKYFAFEKKGFRKVYTVKSKYLSILIRKILLLFDKIVYLFSNKTCIDIKKVGWIHTELRDIEREKNKILFLDGEGFRDRDQISQNKDILIRYFSPKKQYQKKINEILSTNINNNVVLGIHIRRGDFRQWNDGKYYYDDNFYKEAISVFKKNCSDQVFTMIVSDEEINSENFQDIRDVYVSNNELIVDLYLLASSDFIIGPPSTYSCWASFYGSVPIHALKKENSSGIDKHDFKICSI